MTDALDATLVATLWPAGRTSRLARAVLVGPDKAFALGVAPFALATIVKTLLAAALVGAASRAAVERLSAA